MCLGCNSDQPKYVDANKNIHICKSFADKLWTTDPTTYDTCGLNIPQLGLGFVLPSRYYQNATHFLNDLKPPYFEGYTVVIDAETTENCLDSYALKMMTSVLAIALTSFVTMINM